MKYISVIIPSYNSQVIDQTIYALEKQTYPRTSFEVIISGIDSYKLVEEDDLVTFLCTMVPKKPAEARNIGAKHANGEILVFTDSDCIPLPDWLEVIAKRFEDPNVFVLGGSINIHNQNYWTICDNLSMIHDFLPVLSPGIRHNLPGGNLAIRRYIFESEGGFEERARPFGEDTEFSYRLLKSGYTLYFEPAATVYHIPQPRNFRDLISRSYNQGKFTAKFDIRYDKESGVPGWLNHRLILLFLSPLLALAVTIKIYLTKSILFKYWKAFPMIFVMKLLWCFGAVNRPSFKD